VVHHWLELRSHEGRTFNLKSLHLMSSTSILLRRQGKERGPICIGTQTRLRLMRHSWIVEHQHQVGAHLRQQGAAKAYHQQVQPLLPLVLGLALRL
jgi:hypothetical protein